MSTRTKSVVWLVLLVFLINFPLVQSALTRRDVERSGADVTATLVDHEVLGTSDDPQYWISYRLPTSIDPDQDVWPRELERSAYDEVVAAGRLTVRAIEGEPVSVRVPGQVVSRAGLVATLVADLLVLGFVLVLWRFGRYGRPERTRPETIRLEAIGDVREGGPVVSVDEDASGTVVVRGTLTEVTDHEVVLEVGRGRVVVVLDGHRVLADLHSPAEVPGRRLV